MVKSTGSSNNNSSAHTTPRPLIIGSTRSSVDATPIQNAPEKQLAGKARQRALARDNQIRKSAGLAISKQTRPSKNLGHGDVSKRSLASNAVAQYELSEAEIILESNTIVEATRHMAAKKLDFVLVVDVSGRLKGIVTDKDLAFRVVAENLDPRQTTVGQVMTVDPQCVQSTMGMIDALTKMVSNHFRHLPVMEDERVVGVLDIAKCLYDALQKLELADAAANQIANAIESVKEFKVVKREENEALGVAETIRERLACPKISSIIGEDETSCTIVNVKSSVLQAVKLMKTKKDTAALVTDEQGGNLVGIFTTKDVLLRVIAAGLDPTTTTIIRVMTPHPDSTTPDESIVTALRQMHIGRYLHLPVLGSQDRSIVGVVDVLQLTYSMLEQLSQLNGTNESPLWHQLWSPSPTDDLLDTSSTHGTNSERRSDIYRSVHQVALSGTNPVDDFTPLLASAVFKIKHGSDAFLMTIDNILDLPRLEKIKNEAFNRFGLAKGNFFLVDEEDDLIPIRDDEEFGKFIQMAISSGKDRISFSVQSSDPSHTFETTQKSRTPLYLLVGTGLTVAGTICAVLGFLLLKSQK